MSITGMKKSDISVDISLIYPILVMFDTISALIDISPIYRFLTDISDRYIVDISVLDRYIADISILDRYIVEISYMWHAHGLV